MPSAERHVRAAFEQLIVMQNQLKDIYDLPAQLFTLHERKASYTWPGLEDRFQDFKWGSKWAVDTIRKEVR